MTDGAVPLLWTGRTEMDAGSGFGQHRHTDHLIAWSETVTVTMRTGTRDWLVPPTHALWIPAGTPHAFTVRRGGHGYGVVVRADRCPLDWDEPTGVLITPLVRELIVHLGRESARTGTRDQAEALLLALLEPVPSRAFRVPLPTDPRARAIADALIADPADRRGLEAWAHTTSTGVRTIARLFARETGTSFAQWRTLVRVRAALPYLARGVPVAATARAVGYRKPGTFSEAFRRVTGIPPGQYG